LGRVGDVGVNWPIGYIPFTRSSKHPAYIEQTSSKHRTNIELDQTGLLEPRPWLNVGLGLGY